MAPQIDPKSMRIQGSVADTFLERPLGAKGGVRGTKSGTHLATIFDQKSKKWHPKRHLKIEAEKVSKMYAKRLPK